LELERLSARENPTALECWRDRDKNSISKTVAVQSRGRTQLLLLNPDFADLAVFACRRTGRLMLHAPLAEGTYYHLNGDGNAA